MSKNGKSVIIVSIFCVTIIIVTMIIGFVVLRNNERTVTERGEGVSSTQTNEEKFSEQLDEAERQNKELEVSCTASGRQYDWFSNKCK